MKDKSSGYQAFIGCITVAIFFFAVIGLAFTILQVVKVLSA